MCVAKEAYVHTYIRHLGEGRGGKFVDGPAPLLHRQGKTAVPSLGHAPVSKERRASERARQRARTRAGGRAREGERVREGERARERNLLVEWQKVPIGT